MSLDWSPDPELGIGRQAAKVIDLLIHHLAPLLIVGERWNIAAAALQHLQHLLPAEAVDALFVGPGKAEGMQLTLQQGQLAVDLQGDHPG